MISICDNCGTIHEDIDLDSIEDFEQRVDADEIVPSGQCPKCGALCHHKGSLDWEPIVRDIIRKREEVLPLLIGINKELDNLIAEKLSLPKKKRKRK